MPAKDIFHDCVKHALIKDGWIVTDDPLSLKIGKKDLFIDLAAEKILMAEKGTEKIAVEIKSFTRPSDMKDRQEAVGQFVVYTHLLRRYYPEYKLFLAVSENTCKTVFEEEAGQTLIEDGIIELFSFDPNQEVIVRWLP